MNIKAYELELDNLSHRWQELDAELSEKIREFEKWIEREFPRPPGPWGRPWTAYRIYGLDGSWPSLDIEFPCGPDGFRFEATDDDGSMQTYILPFLWLEDPEAFRAVAAEKIADTEREYEAARTERERNERERKIAAARKLLAEVDGQ